ncbi:MULTISPECIES: helix-turn-helix domain-containing protein [Pseudomonas]|uniref:helix-turn-helix domain-containing protein n=2 Tax=Pseudomonas TaxID=286 RepID=UPI0009B943FA|nr:helix-turn-helix domain-containing protein [Pseudomonas synxantha]DAH56361.1 MAG TPA: winged helix-turn-helix DNA-binding protein [Caudoviricetes sp.]
MSDIDMPTDPTSRWEWIKYQLRVRGTSMAKLARQLEVTDRAIRNAKSTPYPRIERSLADALCLEPSDIWPERWNADGTPHRQRPGRAEINTSYNKDTGQQTVGHCKAARSA